MGTIVTTVGDLKGILHRQDAIMALFSKDDHSQVTVLVILCLRPEATLQC
jgi:hypothetical protein